MHVYALIHTEAGAEGNVIREIKEIDGVASVELVAGAYDVIARAETHSLEEFSSGVLPRIQHLGGVIRTMTCPAAGRGS